MREAIATGNENALTHSFQQVTFNVLDEAHRSLEEGETKRKDRIRLWLLFCFSNVTRSHRGIPLECLRITLYEKWTTTTKGRHHSHRLSLSFFLSIWKLKHMQCLLAVQVKQMVSFVVNSIRLIKCIFSLSQILIIVQLNYYSFAFKKHSPCYWLILLISYQEKIKPFILSNSYLFFAAF